MAEKKRIRSTYICSFCGKNQDQVQRLIAGPGGVYICNECISLFADQINEEQSAVASTTNEAQKSARCSFCSKKQKQVQHLVTGPHQVNICNECIDLCCEIIASQQS